MDLKLAGKTAIITGGASGIGAGIARAFAAEGTNVAILDIDAPRAQAIAKQISDQCNAQCFAFHCDVTSREDVSQTIDAILGKWSGIHILVNNVGVVFADWLEDVSDKDIDKCLAVNCASHLLVVRAVVPVMKRQRWGRIIFISSGSGLKASAGLALYSASKYFVRGLGVAAGLELGQFNITANVVCPSDVFPDSDAPVGAWANTKLVEISCLKEKVETFRQLVEARRQKNPMRRTCSIEDIASLTCFLASEQAGFINAQTIAVNGGAIPT
jgi:3-oxoacyl-[acyl-carrier protein] reductase